MRIESVAAGQPTPTSKEDKKLKQACQDFEAVFMGFMLKGMRKTVQKSELFGSSREEEMFTDMMDDEVCKSASRSKSIGIADLLYKQLAGANQDTRNENRGEVR